MKISKITLNALPIFIILAGCSSTDPVRVEKDFGNSVRHMVESQTYNPAAIRNPSSEPPTELDGEKASAVIESYRAATSKPENIEKPIVINVGK